jgi:chemotaxis protein MotB
MILPPPDRVQARSAPGWMITFADLLSLLLAFFVLVFAATSVEPGDWQRNVLPISAYLSGRHAAAGSVAQPALDIEPRLDPIYLSTLLDRLVEADPALAGAHIRRRAHAVELALAPNFVPAASPPPLAGLARLLATLDNRVELVVHTGIDPTPNADPVASWRRALALAQSVDAELNRLGDRRSVALSGMIDLPGGPEVSEIVFEIGDAASEASNALP